MIKWIEVRMENGEIHQYKLETPMELWEFHERMFGKGNEGSPL